MLRYWKQNVVGAAVVIPAECSSAKIVSVGYYWYVQQKKLGMELVAALFCVSAWLASQLKSETDQQKSFLWRLRSFFFLF